MPSILISHSLSCKPLKLTISAKPVSNALVSIPTVTKLNKHPGLAPGCFLKPVLPKVSLYFDLWHVQEALTHVWNPGKTLMVPKWTILSIINQFLESGTSYACKTHYSNSNLESMNGSSDPFGSFWDTEMRKCVKNWQIRGK